jgi:7,8-dihydropterin-6-yl-methyl-4-(beta-D-ribofuranosyl)aminobenzene 5'-phosphate synthase
MKIPASVKAADRVEILTLQDNYIDLTAGDGNAMVTRASIVRDGEVRNSILSEHGFSAVVTVYIGDEARSVLFDFGFSPGGAASNARTLGVDMGRVEAAVLSHGHVDHFGGLAALAGLIGKRGLDLVVHPKVFQTPRYLRFGEDVTVFFPEFSRETAEAAGFTVVETAEPRLLLDGAVLFLGEVPRTTAFERGMPSARCLADGEEQWDAIEDDTALVMNVKDKGLVILSGCAHAGIVNTIFQARAVAGVEKVHAVMGGFHLTGPVGEAALDATTAELKRFAPDYVIPTHCTGRKSIMHIEREMPEGFVLNMAGTKLTFTAP